MATFIVCTRCGKTQEVDTVDPLPRAWQQTPAGLLCPRCADADEDEAVGDVLDEEVIYPSDGTDDTLDEGYCEVCDGPCQGH